MFSNRLRFGPRVVFGFRRHVPEPGLRLRYYEYQPGSTNLDTRLANVTGDVSAFAGQTVQLKFTTVQMPGSVVNGLDGIDLSTQAAPEPAETSLFLLGLCLMGYEFGSRRRSDARK